MDSDTKNEIKEKVTDSSRKTEFDEQFALLSKKIDEQFKFTRTVVVLCTLVTIGLTIFTVLLTFESLPMQVTLYCMSNLEPIVKQWQQVDTVIRETKERQRQSAEPKTVEPAKQ